MKKKRLFILLSAVVIGAALYFTPPHRVNRKIPISFIQNTYIPLIQSEIQGKRYQISVDLGSCNSLSLLASELEHLRKTDLHKSSTTVDFRDNEYNSPIYLVPEVHIASVPLSDCEIVQEKPEFYNNTNLWSKNHFSLPESQGRIGWPFFNTRLVLLDFPNSAIFLADTMDELITNRHLDIGDFISTPLSMPKRLLVIDIETDWGMRRMALDTGASYCTFRKDKIDPNAVNTLPNEGAYCKSDKLQIGDTHFGPWSCVVGDFTALDAIDGVLGVDFFLEHAVLIDFEHQMVYVERPKGVLGTQWRRAKFYLTQFFVKHFSKEAI